MTGRRARRTTSGSPGRSRRRSARGTTPGLRGRSPPGRPGSRPGSCPPQFVESLVVDPVEVADLVDEGRVHLIAQVVLVLARGQMRFAVHDDAVGQLTHPIAVALRESQAVVEAEKVEA